MRLPVLRRPVLLLVPVLVLLGLGGSPRALGREAVPALDAALTAKIRARLAKAGVAPGRYGVVVLERGPRPRARVRLGARQALVPASVAKLLTAAVALDLLGPGHAFETLVSALGPIRDGTLEGDLVVHGGGDPAVQASFLGEKDPRYALHDLARQVRAAGVRRVAGSVVLDPGAVDGAFTHPSWTEADRRAHYGAGVAGLSLHEGCVAVRVRGAKTVGGTPVVEFPTTRGPYAYRLLARTVAGKHAAIGAAFSGRPPVLRITGKVPPRGTVGIKVPVPDPVLFFGGAFVRVLRAAGVAVAGGIRRAADDRERAGGPVIAQLAVPMARVLPAMDVYSRNAVASTLFRLAGARLTGRGSWGAGEAAVSTLLRVRSLDPTGTRIVDGSGLSPENRTTAGLLAALLTTFDGDLLRGPLLYDSLAVSGTSGTLRKRLRSPRLRGRVHAKTGTLNDVRARGLAGYVDGADGRPGWIFAILLNGRGASSIVIDDLVRLIVRS